MRPISADLLKFASTIYECVCGSINVSQQEFRAGSRETSVCHPGSLSCRLLTVLLPAHSSRLTACDVFATALHYAARCRGPVVPQSPSPIPRNSGLAIQPSFFLPSCTVPDARDASSLPVRRDGSCVQNCCFDPDKYLRAVLN